MNHRSSRPRRWLPARRSSRPPDAVADAVMTLRASEIIVSWSDPFVLERGHPWRSIPCLVCDRPAADHPVRCAVILGAAVTSAMSWRTGSAGYLLCESHGRPPAEAIYWQAHQLEAPGCRCHTRSAAGAETYPYHEEIPSWLN